MGRAGVPKEMRVAFGDLNLVRALKRPRYQRCTGLMGGIVITRNDFI